MTGCTENSDPIPASLDQTANPIPPLAQQTTDPCADPTSTDCPCVQEGSQIDCGSVHEMRGDYVICSLGVRTCAGGSWSDCEARQLTNDQAAARKTTTDGLRLMTLSAGANCNNLCDPQCISLADTATGLTVADNLQADSDGLTLPQIGSGGHCSSLTISPANATINVTAIAANGAITASPASVAFSATCSTGVTVQPSWSIDSYDRAQINASGTLTPFSGIGSSILVTATSSLDTKTALVSVITNITKTAAGMSSAITNALNGASFSTDAGKTLYPYNNTVFPLDLKAPLVQWDTGSKTSTGTMVALRYAVSGTTVFWYSSILAADPTDGTLHAGVPSWQIPQEIWSAFDRSAAGDPLGADIIVRRYYLGAAHEMKIHVKFATQPLYGSVYYTQYKRTFMPATACVGQSSLVPGSYAPGSVCPVGNCTNLIGTLGASTTRTIDLSKKTAPNTDPFNGASVYCPVCHSVSASGSVHVAGSQAWVQQPNGSQLPMPGHSVNSIGATASGDPFFSPIGNSVAPTYTGLSDSGISDAAGDPYANYERIGENSRGFAYGALSPDGSLVMQGPSFWGSGQDTPAANNTQNASVTGLGGSLEPFFLLKTAQPGAGVQFATTAALPSNTWSGGVFSGSFGALTVDGVTLNALNQSVLVKDETTKNRNGIYVLSQVNPWKLSRRYDASSGAGTSNVMAGGMDVRVTDGNANVGKVFYISSPSTGTNITFSSGAASSTTLTFSERLMPGQYGSSAFTVDYATTAALPSHTQNTSAPATLTASANGPLTIDGVAMPVGAAILVKDEASQTHNGIYTVTVKGSSSAPTAAWKLTRRSDADASNELHGQQEVKVTSGSYNGGRVFFISSPASGGITINSAIAFTETSLPAMLTPTISPNGSKIAYVNADADTTYGLADGGWRRTLSMMSFDQSAYTANLRGTVFSNKKRLLNNWSSGSTGVPIKWPFFEGDSRSLIFVQTESTDYCSAADESHSLSVFTTNTQRACFDGGYGSMSPTARGYWKGSLWAIDTQTPANYAELALLNNAEDPTDADHAYQPTVLPISVGGYRWVIFSSNRSYGNQFNYRGPTGTPTHFTCSASMLWVAAIDDRTADASDRSHPAFLLPGQNMASITAGAHYINERGYLVPSPCKNSGASCSSDEECCGSSSTPATSACRAPTSWTPASGTPAKTCAALSGTCSNTGGSCATPADCCNLTACTNFACAAPPSYTEATFDRDYTASCAAGYQPNWQLFSYYLTTGNGSSIAFAAKTATTAGALAIAPSLAIGTSTATVVSPATPAFFDVAAVLNANHMNGKNYLRITVDLIPSADGQTAPVLHDWEMRYTCVAAQ